MNIEIKEILDLLKYCVDKNEYLEEPNMKNWKPLLDYITNLQQEIEKLNDDKRGMLVQLYKANDEKDKIKQENERLKERVAYLKRSNNRREDTIIGLRFEVAEQEDYKSRCEKAIEYIKDFRTEDYILVGKNSLLNILQNRGDSE